MNSKIISKIILQSIISGKLRSNEKLPSEKQLSIKHDVSRIVATNVYKNLKKIGAIYSIPKKGFFVAENLTGIVISVNNFYKIDKLIDSEPDIDLVLENDLYNFKYFKREHYSKGILKIVSYNWINTNSFEYKKNKDFIDDGILNEKITKSTHKLKFEKIFAFNHEENLVDTTFYYFNQNIIYIEKTIVDKKYFSLSKNDWNI
ncbi:MAG: GntR family transcriptional regulator [Mycoplasmatales bacterium]|nr:GntR family transcriptional regulator [Mycoplasmatales bacterium]